MVSFFFGIIIHTPWPFEIRVVARAQIPSLPGRCLGYLSGIGLSMPATRGLSSYFLSQVSNPHHTAHAPASYSPSTLSQVSNPQLSSTGTLVSTDKTTGARYSGVCVCVRASPHSPHLSYYRGRPLRRDSVMIISSYSSVTERIHICSLVADKPRQKRSNGNEETP